MAANDAIIVEVGADVSGLTSGLAQVKTSLISVQDEAVKMAARLIADGESAEDAASALRNLGLSAKDAAAAIAAVATSEEKATEAAATQTEAVREQAVAFTGLDRAMAQATTRIVATESGLGGMGTALGRVAAQSGALGPLLSAAFPVIGIAAFAAIAVELGEKVYHAYENVVLLKSSIDALDKVAMSEADHQASLNYQFDVATAKLLENQQQFAAARAEYQKASSEKPLELTDLKAATEDKEGIKQYSEGLRQIAQSANMMKDVPTVVAAINAEITSTATQLATAKKQEDDLNASFANAPGEAAASMAVLAQHNEASITDLSKKLDVLKGSLAAIQSQTGLSDTALQENLTGVGKAQSAQTEREITDQEKLARTVLQTNLARAEAPTAPALQSARLEPGVDLSELEAKRTVLGQEYQLTVDETTKELALYKSIPDKYKEALDKQKQNKANYELQIAELDKAEGVEVEKQITHQAELAETTARTNAIRAEGAASEQLETAKALPELDLSGIEAKKAALKAALEEEKTQNLAAANAEYQIALDLTNKELALNPVGTQGHKDALDKQAHDETDYVQKVESINRESKQKIADSDRELETKYREMLDKQAEDAQAAANKTAEIEIAVNRQAQDQIINDSKRTMELRQAQQKASLIGVVGGPIVEVAKIQEATTQYAANDREIQQLTEDLGKYVIAQAQLSNVLAGGGSLTQQQMEQLKALGEEINRTKERLKEIGISQAQLGQEMLTSWQQIGNTMKSTLDVGFNTFNSNIQKMLTTNQSFTKTMINTWNSMVESLVGNVLKNLETSFVTMAGLQVTQATAGATGAAAAQKAGEAETQLAHAKSAAAGAYSAMSSIPVIGPALGAVAAATVFAAALAFEQGGIIPGQSGQAVPITGHAGEAVLPEHLTSFLLNAAGNTSNSTTNSSSSSSTSVNMENHFHNQKDLSETNVSRLLMRSVKRGKLGSMR